MRTIDSVPMRGTHAWWAAAGAALLLGITLRYLPIVDQPWGFSRWFPAMYFGGIFLLDALIALFLGLQVLAGEPTRALAWLSGGYAFAAVVSITQFLTFPGLLAQPLGADAADQIAVSLWIFWHAGFPCFVLMSAVANAKTSGRPAPHASSQRLINLFPVLLGIAAALSGAALLLYSPDLQPAFVEGDDYSRFSHSFVSGVLLALNVFALLAVIYLTRLHNLIGVWLALAMFAFTLDVVLSTAALARYNAGWYVARILSLASAAALIVALLIESYNLYRDAEIRAAFHEQEAMHDPLTGLYNRRYLLAHLGEELGRARRYRHPVSLLLLDVDHFKRINDRHGHAAGDQCLRALARVLGERVHRQGDITARYGGEEFVVVLPETGVDGAVDAAEDVRRRIEALHANGTLPWPLTASIGVATADSSAPASASPEALLAEADGNLYRAKEQGRNRVVWPRRTGEPPAWHATPA
ncbi:MAG: sensor domain-containing diguanylate cyclase [Rhodocyclaceae bacterium]